MHESGIYLVLVMGWLILSLNMFKNKNLQSHLASFDDLCLKLR